MTRSDIFTIRPSSLPSYNDCPRRTIAKAYPFLLRDAGYFPRELPSSVGAAVGSSVHKAGEHSLRIKMETGGNIGTDADAIDAAVAEFDERIEEGVIWDDTTPTRDAAQRQIDVMSKMYRSRIVPKLTPIMIEGRIELKYKPGFLISGQPDVVEANGALKPSLRDTKTGVVRRANSAQYGDYIALLNSVHIEVGNAVEDFLQRVRVNAPQPEPESHSYDVKACVALAKATNDRMIRDIQTFLETGDIETFAPNPMSMMCGDKYCPLHGTDACPHHKKD